jgi:hypothetical protein
MAEELRLDHYGENNHQDREQMVELGFFEFGEGMETATVVFDLFEGYESEFGGDGEVGSRQDERPLVEAKQSQIACLFVVLEVVLGGGALDLHDDLHREILDQVADILAGCSGAREVDVVQFEEVGGSFSERFAVL